MLIYWYSAISFLIFLIQFQRLLINLNRDINIDVANFAFPISTYIDYRVQWS